LFPKWKNPAIGKNYSEFTMNFRHFAYRVPPVKTTILKAISQTNQTVGQKKDYVAMAIAPPAESIAEPLLREAAAPNVDMIPGSPKL
jgi:hypothetical protein